MDMLSYKYENGSITINKSHFTEKKNATIVFGEK